ncbi:MAG: response regulator transcription factor [Thermaerobacter sp.]|nr:DNA-binding response regulator [Bacillota bacterium]
METTTLKGRRILVVDDDRRITSVLRRGLERAGCRVTAAHDGPEGLRMAQEDPPDAVVLDVMMPGMDGIEVCRRLRSVQPDLPVLMLTARDEVPDRVQGLDAGADDYLVKPFAFAELEARLRAILRRRQPRPSQVLRFADLELNVGTRTGRRGDRSFSLTAKEFQVLELLMRNPRQVLPAETILERVWGWEFEGDINIVQAYVMRLRQKTEAGGEPRLIHTVRNQGYVLREEQP